MAVNSAIEWTDATWNPVTGCTKVSPGCKNCYAERMAMRLQSMGQPNYRNGFSLTLQQQALHVPLHWRKPRTIFVNSMADLFHIDVPDAYIKQTFDVMRQAHWHRFQILTKRSERLRSIASSLDWRPNMWMGVSIESKRFVHRADHLRDTGAHIKFLSIEPLLGPIDNLDLSGIDWVIVGGESGPGARPMRPAWVIALREQCKAANVAFFFKQWGGVNKGRNGRLLEGRTWDEVPRNNGSLHNGSPGVPLNEGRDSNVLDHLSNGL